MGGRLSRRRVGEGRWGRSRKQEGDGNRKWEGDRNRLKAGDRNHCLKGDPNHQRGLWKGWGLIHRRGKGRSYWQGGYWGWSYWQKGCRY